MFYSELKSKVGNILDKVTVLRINLNIRINLNLDGTPIVSRSHTHSDTPLTLSNISPLNLVSIFGCTRPPINPEFEGSLDPSDLVFSLSLSQCGEGLEVSNRKSWCKRRFIQFYVVFHLYAFSFRWERIVRHLCKSLLEGTLQTIMWSKWGPPSIPFLSSDLMDKNWSSANRLTRTTYHTKTSLSIFVNYFAILLKISSITIIFWELKCEC